MGGCCGIALGGGAIGMMTPGAPGAAMGGGAMPIGGTPYGEGINICGCIGAYPYGMRGAP